MKAVLSMFLMFALAASGLAATAQSAASDPVAGTYYGSYKTKFMAGTVEAQIRALGKGEYDGFLVMKYQKDGADVLDTLCLIREFKPEDGRAPIFGRHPNAGLTPDDRNKSLTFPEVRLEGELTPGKITASWIPPFVNDDTKYSLEMVKTTPTASPTLGAKPPADAVVLFDGKPNKEWKNLTWPVKDGVLTVGKGNITTEKSFTNALLHLEFRTPFMPEPRGQARGNSGVYLRSVFEVQVLDSFGLFPLANNDCGGMYQVQAPDWRQINACLPPGEWQTYDITYREGDKQAKRLPVVSVMHNGKLIMNNVQIPLSLVEKGTGGGEVGGGFLMLQDHGDPVEYRNIWVQPID